ncbi:hypothetical protein ABID22_001189 [Pontibacter aydingkolensis]|nr:hypothetical protein [Pontibacter aydingkolensis]
MIKLFFENDAIRIYLDEEQHLGIGEWKGFASSSKIRQTAP